MKRATLYARLSRVKGEDISVERQVAACSDFIRTNHLLHDPTADQYIEPRGHRSGADDSRPAYSALLRRIAEQDDVSHIVVYEPLRFARSDQLVQRIIDFEKRGIKFVSIVDPIDVTTSQGRFVGRLKSAFGVMYREEIADRNRRAFASIKAAGGWVGGAPLWRETNIHPTSRLPAAVNQSQVKEWLDILKPIHNENDSRTNEHGYGIVCYPKS